ncbi:TAXI family TRAP transporter solute-binding subunit [Palleronia caenipelagi]|uniref:TAXI family TRAP transporter solute-binding subunit n=1 Tax=Palleronia caenipelagi TaxID=2489174 RepID=A0A547Q2P3_9RHOB|nr:TAXI family TRAP transporter solute-binding subunit [Palleronia caenipelagi]TRD20665.1 TAXI family TRAP transporter solute-binding subunit [Palleronia caenipelagi]
MGRLLALFLLCFAGLAQAQGSTSILIGTGGVAGIYFPAGGAICQLVNMDRPRHRTRCSVTSTTGSVTNLQDLDRGDLDFAVVQADWQAHAYNGTSIFEAPGPMTDLRAVFSLHPEFYTVVVRENTPYESFDDLKYLRLNAGARGSGQRATTEILLDAMGWGADDFAAMPGIQAADQPAALCAGEIDAMVYMVGHPSAAIVDATSDCASRIVRVDNDGVRKLVDRNPLYNLVTIPGGVYRGNDDDQTTFGIDATLVTRADVPEKVVYDLVKSVFTRLDTMQRMHTAFIDLDPQQMATASLTAPLHPGAERYFREVGLLPQ